MREQGPYLASEPAVISAATPFEIGWDYWYRVSDDPFTTDSPMWVDDGTTQMAPEDSSGDLDDWTLFRIDNAGVSDADSLWSRNRTVGNGRDLVDSASGNLLNGHPGLDDQGGDPGLSSGTVGSAGTFTAGNLLHGSGNKFEVFFVFTASNIGAVQAFLDRFNFGSDTDRCFVGINASGQVYLYAGTAQTLTTLTCVNGKHYFLYAVFDEASSFARLIDSDGNDTTEVVGGSIGTNDCAGVTLWADRNGGNSCQGIVRDAGIRRTQSSATELLQLRLHISSYWGI